MPQCFGCLCVQVTAGLKRTRVSAEQRKARQCRLGTSYICDVFTASQNAFLTAALVDT